MCQCHVCGLESESALKINYNGGNFQFDCFECAIYELAPSCAHCGLIVLSHGVRVNQQLYCSGSCARFQGQGGQQDFFRHRGT